MVRINKNRALFDPGWKQILASYKRKYRKVPTLADDCTDDEGADADGEDSGSEGEGMDSD